ncbi:MAG: ribosomal L7Ae/L30e/S12e/Gadd45 family protein [Desulfotomaculales bacterium]|jgi:large subunit ribosomal protein L7A
MPLARLSAARKRTVGSKQTLKAVLRKEAKAVYIAADAERHVTEPIRKACLDNNVTVIEVDSMRTLGKTCGIEVGCASAAIIEE